MIGDLDYVERRLKYKSVSDYDIETLSETLLVLKDLLMDHEWHTASEIINLLKNKVQDPIKEIRHLRMKGHIVYSARDNEKEWIYRLLSPLEKHKHVRDSSKRR